MTISSSSHQTALSLARRSVVQSMPPLAKAFSSEHAAGIKELAKGYGMEKDDVTDKLRGQQSQMASSLRSLGHERAAHATELRLGIAQPSRQVER